MNTTQCFNRRFTLIILLMFALTATSALAQTTEFTYQGSLKDGAAAANGNYNFEFALFDALSGGTQIGSTLPRNTVVVTGGIFAVKLDFGGQFPGADRFLEIHVRPTGGGSFTPLTPRQPVSSAPYSLRSLNATAADTALNAANAANATTATNATQLGGIAASQYVLTGDARLSDARNPLPGSGSYIQNRTSEQALANFNVSGNGTAGGTLTADIVKATMQFNIGGNRVLSTAGTNNLFAGVNAGPSNTGSENAFFGRGAGFANTGGTNNAFFGYQAGNANTTSYNSFFGAGAGFNNTSGYSNSFVGQAAGLSNTMGSGNTFVGVNGGNSNTTGVNNTTLGTGAGAYPLWGSNPGTRRGMGGRSLSDGVGLTLW